MPKIEHFDKLNESGKWLVCHLLTYVPDRVWARTEDGRPDIKIRINGYLIEDLDSFFEDVGRAMDDAITTQAACLANQQAGEILGKLSDVVYSITQELKSQIAQRFDIDPRRLTDY